MCKSKAATTVILEPCIFGTKAKGAVQGNSHLKAAMRTLPSTVRPLGGGNGSAVAGFAQPAGRHKKRKAPLAGLRQAGRESSGDLLSRIRGPGTIGDLGLNFRVRDGNGCDPHSITAETISLAWKPKLLSQSPEH